MKHRNILSVWMVFFWVLALGSATLPVSGCNGFIPAFSSEGPELTPAERALSLNQQYQALEDTYKSHFTYADEAERQWMRENLAPLLDRARMAVALYSQSVLADVPDSDYWLEAIALIREITMSNLRAIPE